MGNLRPVLDSVVTSKLEVLLTLKSGRTLGPGSVEPWMPSEVKYDVIRMTDMTCVGTKDSREGAQELVRLCGGIENEFQIKMTGEGAGIYRINSKALAGAGPGREPHEVTVPTIFDAADVEIVVEVPKNIENEPLIARPGGGKRTPGGLHIG